MLNKLIIVFISLVLTSCFFEKTKKPVVIIDRSTGQENIDFDRFAITSQAEEEMTDRKIDKKTNSALIPVAGRIIKTFSKDHQGLSFATNFAQAVRAVKDGMVVYSGNKNKKNGKTIIIKHALGFYSSYMQNQTLQVQSGDKVKKGQVIATTGKNNFYFEMKKFETPINPIKYLK
jgi:lipoprotein NlpD